MKRSFVLALICLAARLVGDDAQKPARPQVKQEISPHADVRLSVLPLMTYYTGLRQNMILILAVLALNMSLIAGQSGNYNPYIPPTPKVTAASVEKAKEVLASGEDDAKYLGAVQVILASSLSEKEKHKALSKLFLDEKRMLAFHHQTRRPGHYSDAYDSRNLVFQLCTEKLKAPADFYMALSKDPQYNLNRTTGKTGSLHSVFFFNLIGAKKKEPADEFENFMKSFLLPFCKKDSRWHAIGLFSKYASNDLLREALATPEKWSEYEQREAVPRIVVSDRLRMVVFEFLVNEYFRQDFNYYIRDCILGKDIWFPGPRRVPLPGYAKVPDKDAAAYVKQIDRLLAIKDKLQKLKETDKTADNKEYPERWRRWTDKHVARLKEIRRILTQKAEAFQNQQKPVE
jgi:hypothetical protein